MARKVTIRWTASLESDLKKEITRYRKKVSYAKRKYGFEEATIFVEPQTYKNVKRNIKTKSQYNAYIKALRKFSARGVKPGVPKEKSYKYQIRNFKLPTVENKKMGELAAKINKPQSGRFPTQEDFIKKEIGIVGSDEDWGRIRDWTATPNGKLRSSRWRDNYLQTLKDNMVMMTYIGDEESFKILMKIYNKVATMGLDAFLLGQLVSPAILAIGEFITSPKGNKVDESDLDLTREGYKRVLEEWEKYS